MFAKRRQETGCRIPVARATSRGRDLGRDALARRAESLEPRRGSGLREGLDRAILRRSGEVHAGSRLVERQRIRPARAALSQSPARRDRVALLGARRQRSELPLPELSQPLPLAPHGPDGHPVRISGPRPGQPQRRGDLARLARKDRHERRRRVGRVPARRAEAHPRLLRDRRVEHLPDLSSLRAGARQSVGRGARRGSRARASTCWANRAAPHLAEFAAAWPEN